jgi:thymidylate synthase
VSFRLIASELLWFLSGSSDVKKLQEQNNHIWDEWATKEQCAKFGREEGDLGPVYGPLWRKWKSVVDHGWDEPVTSYIDQISNIIQQIKTSPSSRRLIVSGWNPATCDKVALPPCHTMFQFKVTHDNTRLNCQLYQRSGDVGIGIPFNIASYALLTHLIAQVTGLEVGEFIHTIGDAHVYSNQIDGLREQLTRSPFEAPQLQLDPTIKNIDDFKLEHMQVVGYRHHPAIKFEVAV